MTNRSLTKKRYRSDEALVNSARRFLQTRRAAIEATLDRLVPRESEPPERLHGAIRWSLFAGGKRFRPALLLAVGETFGARTEALLATACAFELVHTYSLIHDDLPAMDDDDMRRGRPTCHVRFDEATAILAGDALQSLAFQAIAEDEHVDRATRAMLVAELARAAGTPRGMVAGQAFDLEAEGRSIPEAAIERMHRLKTGAMIVAAARAGVLIAGAGEESLVAVTEYGTQLGLLFQITDDLLDVTATAGDLGKTPGKDLRAGKATYATVYGVPAAREKAARACADACAALDRLHHETGLLRGLALLTLHRKT